MKTTKGKPEQPMPLAELVEEYLKNPTRGPMRRDSAARLRRVAADFSKWLGCPATTGHLSEETVERFLQRRSDGLSPSTVERLRKSVVMLWRFPGELGFPPPPFRPHSRSVRLEPISATARAKPRRETAGQNSQLDRIEDMLNKLRGGGTSPTDRPAPQSAASYFEAAGGSAQKLLGHSDSRVTKRHYLAPRIVKPPQASDLLFRP